jgi:hypothetical protein
MLMYPGGVLKDMAVKVIGDNQLAKEFRSTMYCRIYSFKYLS